MKKIFSILIILLIIPFISEGKDYSFNLSNLKKGEIAQRNIWIVNSSKQPITILKVETGCVCTKADFQKKAIEVGDSSKVEITFHAKDHGVFYKIIEVKTSDSNFDSKITIRGKVN